MVIQRGLLTPEQVWRGGVTAFAIGAALGSYWFFYAMAILALGFPSVAAATFILRARCAAYVRSANSPVFIFMGRLS